MDKQEFELDGQKFHVEMTPEGPEVVFGDKKFKFGPDGFRGAEAFGSTVERVEDGMLTTWDNGVQVKALDGGGVEIVTEPSGIVVDVADVLEHTVTVQGETTIHFIKFPDDGHVELTYVNGKFAKLRGRHVGSTIDRDNVLCIRKFTKTDA